jgi:hypothetical protein
LARHLLVVCLCVYSWLIGPLRVGRLLPARLHVRPAVVTLARGVEPRRGWRLGECSERRWVGQHLHTGCPVTVREHSRR